LKLTILYIIIFILSSTYTFSQTDEFSEFEEKTEFVESNTDDEFSENLDEFSNDEFSEFNETSNAVEQEPESKTNWIRFYWAISILAFTILAGILVRFEKTRKLKPIFLLAAVAILGFYRGGPGIISSFQNTFLFFIGVTDVWPAIVLFLGLIPITYFFGKVFCGWTCYLGAIQEFLC
jgi:lipopolysaccharide export LptBFGC system permease protein LptF